MSESKRLFFAIEPPAKIQRQIVRWRAEHFQPDAGRPVASANLHLTLAFLGDVSADKQQALAKLAGRILQPGFTLNLDDAGQWLRSRVVWLGTRQPPRGLLQLANLLRAQAARSGCYQSPQPFHPHITLLRKHPPCRRHPATRLSLDVFGHRIRPLRIVFLKRTHPIYAASALCVERTTKDFR
ncbi:2'-5' RNA ligase [Lelliottia amnigena]|nr:2'-5' RNA ligase [Lelliottia amnigena]